ncbi:hypothetical protein H0H93_013785 [Arthromyces matolae]|nr:hypothetical protein H0H93_013785 [Arthromyces matolae]
MLAIWNFQGSVERFCTAPHAEVVGYAVRPVFSESGIYKVYVDRVEVQIKFDATTGEAEVVALLHMQFGPTATLRTAKANIWGNPLRLDIEYKPLLEYTAGDSPHISVVHRDGKMCVDYHFANDFWQFVGDYVFYPIKK